jgi:AcrR family transcriptional regulator
MARHAYHHGDLRAALVAATLRVVRRHGPEGVSLRGVASAAGVSEAAPYHHFRDKTALLAAAAGEGFRLLDGCMADGEGKGRNARDRLVGIGVGYVRFALENPGAFRLVFGAHVGDLAKYEEARTPGRAAKRRVRSAVSAFVEDAGLDADAETVFRHLWAQMHGIAWLVVEDELGPDVDQARALDLARDGVVTLLRGLSGLAARGSRPRVRTDRSRAPRRSTGASSSSR